MFAVLILVALVTWSAAIVLTATSMHGDDVMRNSHALDTLGAACLDQAVPEVKRVRYIEQ